MKQSSVLGLVRIDCEFSLCSSTEASDNFAIVACCYSIIVSSSYIYFVHHGQFFSFHLLASYSFVDCMALGISVIRRLDLFVALRSMLSRLSIHQSIH
jgi:hypothetical protein